MTALTNARKEAEVAQALRIAAEGVAESTTRMLRSATVTTTRKRTELVELCKKLSQCIRGPEITMASSLRRAKQTQLRRSKKRATPAAAAPAA
jgi:hypothetical protein